MFGYAPILTVRKIAGLLHGLTIGAATENGGLTMDKDLAIKLLMAVACCSVTELKCYDCPLLEKDGRCRPWRDKEIEEAVRLLNGERRADE